MDALSPLSTPMSAKPSALLPPISVPASAMATTDGAKKPLKPRKRVNTAEKRSQHNAIERARRETLNGKFIVLARLLPSLAVTRRPSKSAIVNESISHLTFQRNQRLLASKLLREIARERDELLREVNEWRSINGYAMKEGQGWSEDMEEVLGVEKEIFGTFASMDDGEQGMEEEEEGMGELIAPHSAKDKAALPSSGFWSADFAYGMGAAATMGYGTPAFANGVNDRTNTSFDASSNTCSPVDSHGTTILTPPMSANECQNQAMHHTSSPSTQSASDIKQSTSAETTIQVQTSARTQAQIPMMEWQQQSYASQLAYHPSRSGSLSSHSRAAHSPIQTQLQAQPHAAQESFNPMTGNTFNVMFVQHPSADLAVDASACVGQAQAEMQSRGQMGDAFAQQLMANVYPGKYDRQPSLSDLQMSLPPAMQPNWHASQKAMRAGMGLGLGIAGSWENNAVKGF
ncbi:uncharacterized protein L203_102325 [Cryptococcus depauperatus CBS 7841]|uniref:Uncharacterized protein n=1 Tax=Cryptococcus depauperatus CBS 7841 TaxID=1295531 RepID=A0A1E3IAB7_9TREE|nr:hypothetical protein L203_04781 [Cryptococcus depauperatus CBS 7841]